MVYVSFTIRTIKPGDNQANQILDNINYISIYDGK